MKVWRIASDTPDDRADELTGTGAKSSGARWNRKGHAMLYCGSHISLAILEALVHLKAGGLPLNRYLVELDIPTLLWKKAKHLRHPPVGWNAIPTGKVSMDIGDHWLRSDSSALMLVPSVIVAEEFNVLINPNHAETRHIIAKKIRKWTVDPRPLAPSG